MQLTVRLVLSETELHPFTVTTTEYVPAWLADTEVSVGFRRGELKPLGPVHAYVAPATCVTERGNVLPVQMVSGGVTAS